MDGTLPLFVASGIWSAMTPVHEENLERLQVGCEDASLFARRHSVFQPAQLLYSSSPVLYASSIYNVQA